MAKTFRKRAYAKARGLKLKCVGRDLLTHSKPSYYREHWELWGNGRGRYFISFTTHSRSNTNARHIKNDIQKWHWPSEVD